MVFIPISGPLGCCPHCDKKPALKFRMLRGARMECACGACGPFVPIEGNRNATENAARAAWGTIAPAPDFPRPPNPGPRT